ncbi:MAG TPA: biotin--[acetyl-CoA-carboxylase] ligase [Methanothermobacter sp.]|nr:biotin ligase [Methanothermobacter sp. MT-2]HHW04327.1 biotin--[acetyl-CoA-carboxylase] ligase [Methanothermobacter sp.]HOK72369.1 biotin--[acetyl-CoA-carboxylase] ligase [Methanothermobacter sp.]HOL69228.1 biotin--[acetyl-CoA-carboxylase] ligase [Methanothermobacter sp.]HPQ03856.1 biotin--[acetyl-CoA-carboxylase] ligase [Methanothermobacter sp.]
MNYRILEFLHENRGKFVSVQDIASKLDLEPGKVLETLEILEDRGYKFEKSGKGYRLKEPEGDLSPSKIKEALETSYIGCEIYCFDEVDSTNIIAKELAEDDAKEGTIVIAKTQTRGRGRRGKKWISPRGGIWMSIILRPDIPPAEAPHLTLITGVAVAKTLKREFGLDVGIKWPNDILIGEKKVCGILTEAHARFNTIEYIVVGIGIDTNVDVDLFPEEFREGATSLKRELGRDVDSIDLIGKLLVEFEKVYDDFRDGRFPEILNEWRRFSRTIGSYVEIRKQLGEVVRGEAVGVNNEGALILELDNGKLRKIVSGECIHLGR